MLTIIKQIGSVWLIRQGPDLVIYQKTPEGMKIYHTDIDDLTPEIINYVFATKDGYIPTRDLVVTFSNNSLVVMDKNSLLSYRIRATNLVYEDNVFTIDGRQIPILIDSPNCVIFKQPLLSTRFAANHNIILRFPYLIIEGLLEKPLSVAVQNQMLIMMQHANFNMEINKKFILFSGGLSSYRLER